MPELLEVHTTEIVVRNHPNSASDPDTPSISFYLLLRIHDWINITMRDVVLISSPMAGAQAMASFFVPANTVEMKKVCIFGLVRIRNLPVVAQPKQRQIYWRRFLAILVRKKY